VQPIGPPECRDVRVDSQAKSFYLRYQGFKDWGEFNKGVTVVLV